MGAPDNVVDVGRRAIATEQVTFKYVHPPERLAESSSSFVTLSTNVEFDRKKVPCVVFYKPSQRMTRTNTITIPVRASHSVLSPNAELCYESRLCSLATQTVNLLQSNISIRNPVATETARCLKTS